MTDEWAMETEGTVWVSWPYRHLCLCCSQKRVSSRVQTLGHARLWPGTTSCEWHGPCSRLPPPSSQGI